MPCWPQWRVSRSGLVTALDRLVARGRGCCSRQGMPQWLICYKRALLHLQDAAYGTLLREPQCSMRRPPG